MHIWAERGLSIILSLLLNIFLGVKIQSTTMINFYLENNKVLYYTMNIMVFTRPGYLFTLFLFVFGHVHGMWKFLGQWQCQIFIFNLLCHKGTPISFFCFVLFFVCFLFFRAAPEAYGGFQARGLIRAVAAGLCHSHGNARSKPHHWPTPQLTAVQDP